MRPFLFMEGSRQLPLISYLYGKANRNLVFVYLRHLHIIHLQVYSLTNIYSMGPKQEVSGIWICSNSSLV